jgi:hypothetical protein
MYKIHFNYLLYYVVNLVGADKMLPVIVTGLKAMMWWLLHQPWLAVPCLNP